MLLKVQTLVGLIRSKNEHSQNKIETQEKLKRL